MLPYVSSLSYLGVRRYLLRNTLIHFPGARAADNHTSCFRETLAGIPCWDLPILWDVLPWQVPQSSSRLTLAEANAQTQGCVSLSHGRGIFQAVACLALRLNCRCQSKATNPLTELICAADTPGTLFSDYCGHWDLVAKKKEIRRQTAVPVLSTSPVQTKKQLRT